jgi:hypothetical protein
MVTRFPARFTTVGVDGPGENSEAATFTVASMIVLMPTQNNMGLGAEEVVRLVAVHQPGMGVVAKHDVHITGFGVEVVELGFTEEEIGFYVFLVGNDGGI